MERARCSISGTTRAESSFAAGSPRRRPQAITDAGLGVNRPKVQAVFDGFAWGIEPWDTDRVKAALEKRGLEPVADHHGSDYRGFRVKDPDGFDVAITNGTKALRRKTPATAKLPAPAPFEPTGWNTLYLDHISFEVPDFRRSAAFYQALLGWDVRPGNGTQASVQIGTIAGAIIRGNAAARAAARGNGAAAPAPASRSGATATIGHISFGIENWDTERVRAELKKRDVVYVNREGERERGTHVRSPQANYTPGFAFGRVANCDPGANKAFDWSMACRGAAELRSAHGQSY